MATAKYRDPETGQYVPILGGSGNAFTGAQVASSAPTPRGVGDLWVDTTATVLEWDTAWKDATLVGTWTRYINYPARYRKLPGGLVVLDGLVGKSGAIPAADLIFTLPVGYRPQYKQHVTVPQNNAAICIAVQSGGGVVVNGAIASITWLSISGITFYAEQ